MAFYFAFNPISLGLFALYRALFPTG